MLLTGKSDSSSIKNFETIRKILHYIYYWIIKGIMYIYWIVCFAKGIENAILCSAQLKSILSWDSLFYMIAPKKNLPSYFVWYFKYSY